MSVILTTLFIWLKLKGKLNIPWLIVFLPVIANLIVVILSGLVFGGHSWVVVIAIIVIILWRIGKGAEKYHGNN